MGEFFDNPWSAAEGLLKLIRVFFISAVIAALFGALTGSIVGLDAKITAAIGAVCGLIGTAIAILSTK